MLENVDFVVFCGLGLGVGDGGRREGARGEEEERNIPNFFRPLSGVDPDWAKCLEAGSAGG
jgi:hypothetical protein